MRKRGQRTQKNSFDSNRPYDWSSTTVSNILAKLEYMGPYSQFPLLLRKSYKDKNALKCSPENERFSRRQTIVDPETWKLVQQIRKTVRRTDTTGEINPLTGLMYYADCGTKTYNHRGRAQAEKDNRGRDLVRGFYPYDYCDCSIYSLAFRCYKQGCFGRYIGTRDVRALLLDTIKTVSAYIISNKAEFIEKVRAASEVRQVQAAWKKTENERRHRDASVNN